MYEVLTVYHGGTDEIKSPLVYVGRPNLDFGPGFYITDIYLQAKEWAEQMADLRDASPIVSVYHLHRQDILGCCKSKVFTSYDNVWLDFVTSNRLGKEAWKGLDYVEGGVANDRVINTVRLYMTGFISADEALRRLKYYKPTNQMCILNQLLLDKHLTFVESIKLGNYE
ncbi:MAG: DUF3990 domain-containing protein [Pseudoflavonifractor sp.]|nr:DUF3990 domain-containing protein [Pseudoflavonifractor sp.]